MNEYLKMADAFALIESDNFQSAMVAFLIAKVGMLHSEASAISHAVSYHDSLVAEVESLRERVSDLEEEKEDMEGYILELQERME